MRHVFHAHLQGVFKTAQQEDRRRMSSLKRRMSNRSTFFFLYLTFFFLLVILYANLMKRRMLMPDRILVKDAAAQWGLTERRVASMCKDGRIPGAYKEGGTWYIPADAERPTDGRVRT
ncbi:MAG: hypothetical protein IKI60_02995, partial [Alloprevotella sp.]|nr:hypothetical protein [Alloprevotella sp.]